ncbi:MAG: hypothetical protein O3A00_03535 [Planctomycetota bacterium]|nr:hypothetical protein [Planctomycetota bacterium]
MDRCGQVDTTADDGCSDKFRGRQCEATDLDRESNASANRKPWPRDGRTLACKAAWHDAEACPGSGFDRQLLSRFSVVSSVCSIAGFAGAAFYARVSSQKQADEQTILSQKDEFIARIQNDNLTIHAECEFDRRITGGFQGFGIEQFADPNGDRRKWVAKP